MVEELAIMPLYANKPPAVIRTLSESERANPIVFAAGRYMYVSSPVNLYVPLFAMDTLPITVNNPALLNVAFCSPPAENPSVFAAELYNPVSGSDKKENEGTEIVPSGNFIVPDAVMFPFPPSPVSTKNNPCLNVLVFPPTMRRLFAI